MGSAVTAEKPNPQDVKPLPTPGLAPGWDPSNHILDRVNWSLELLL